MVSFECLWALFSRLAGPLVQGPEKLKPSYEKMLRHASLGGFMYSAETFLKQEDSGPEAIMEYDLTSAYGFSASNALILSGFCTGFLQPKEGSLLLEKTDTYIRHKSFEFKAVYYTLCNLKPYSDIRTVYSNFLPMGLFYVDKCPADLVVIYNDFAIDNYHFDGYFVHGCGGGCLQKPNQRYINGQTHKQVGAKTEKRDAIFEQWINAVGMRGHHIVIADCHSPGYAPWSLEKAFRTHPELANLVKGYLLVDQITSLMLKDFDNFAQDQTNQSYTFIAWIEGHTVQPSLIVYHPDT